MTATNLAKLPFEDFVAVHGDEILRQVGKGDSPHSFNELMAIKFLEERAPNIKDKEFEKEFRRCTEAMPFFTGYENYLPFKQAQELIDGEQRVPQWRGEWAPSSSFKAGMMEVIKILAHRGLRTWIETWLQHKQGQWDAQECAKDWLEYKDIGLFAEDNIKEGLTEREYEAVVANTADACEALVDRMDVEGR